MDGMKNSRPIRVLVCFGTRPEFIKLYPLILMLRQHADFHVKICSSGQHQHLLEPLKRLFDIEFDYELGVLKEGQHLANLFASVLTGVDAILSSFAADCVIVHGDTVTTIASALGGFFRGIPVAHVEAGLRSGSLAKPFPEEMSRKAIASFATWNFAPTKKARLNLLAEGVADQSIFVTGNTIVDTIKVLEERYKLDSLKNEWVSRLGSNIFDTFDSDFVLITLHRREIWGEEFNRILMDLRLIMEHYSQFSFVWPVHPNPTIRASVDKILGTVKNLQIVKPLEYDEFYILLRNCKVVLTDSGGIQEEAITLGKPIAVLRDTTERTEAEQLDWFVLAGTKPMMMKDNIFRLLDSYLTGPKTAQPSFIFGSGEASKSIVEILRSCFHE
jgi:UDP-N-acetylglucosamine 2-epimerase (non-hydrolysing)